MAIPDYQSLLRPVLGSANRSEVCVRDVLEPLADELELTTAERH